MKTPRVAVIGCGRMGQERAQWIPSAGAAVTLCVDADPGRAAALSIKHPASRTIADTSEIDWKTIDAAFFCTPPGGRESLVLDAIRHDVAVFVEKPPSLRADIVERLADAVDERGMISAVGYMNRYRTGIVALREQLQSDCVKLLGIVAHWTCGRYRVPWWNDRRISGGPFNEQATHLVDLCRYLGGEIEEIAAVANDSEERVAAALRFQGGALATLFYSCEAAEKGIGLQAVTDGGIVRFEGWDFHTAAQEPATNPFEAEVQAFIHAVLTGDRSAIRCDLRDALGTQRVVDGMRNAFSRRPLAGAAR